jgi:hypothetical protein
MIIEKPGFYKTEEGIQAEIICYDPNRKLWVGWIKGYSSPYVWDSSGIFALNQSENGNIIAPWQEPLDFDWSCLSKWARWIAMDEDGEWYQFTNKPELLSRLWRDKLWRDKYDGPIPPSYAPKNFTGDWKDSLFENPKYGVKP